MTTSENSADAGNFCAGCGLCCDGTLFTRAKVLPGEEEAVFGGGLERTSADGKTYFSLPCKHLSCGRCTIYDSRFHICHEFRCALLRSFDAHEIELDQARALVATAKELKAKVTATEPSDAAYARRWTVRRDIEQGLPLLEGQERSRALSRLLDIVALDTFLTRWFRNKKPQTQDTGSEATVE